MSVLEGGYNIKLGPVSPLAQSVASHVRTLLNTHNGPLLRPKAPVNLFIEQQAQARTILGKRRAEFDSPEMYGEGLMSLRKRRKTEDEPAQMQQENVGQQEAEYFEPVSNGNDLQ